MRTIIVTLKLFAVLTLLTGIIYPLAVTSIGLVCFPRQAKGSIVSTNNIPIGSKLIGQEFAGAQYIHSRPSDCSFSTIPSGASNLGPTSKQLNAMINSRIAEWHSVYGLNSEVPGEMVTSSGSGLDPDISVESARIQLTRVAKVRNWNNEQLRKAINILNKLTDHFPGEQYKEGTVNVLLLNKSLQYI